jgi:HAMP domain-containing protein
LRDNVDGALLGAARIGGMTQEDAAQNFLVGASTVGIHVTAAMGALVPASAREPLAELPALLGPFMTQADRLSSLAFTDLAAATASMPAFDEVADQIGLQLDAASAALDELVGDARERRNVVAHQTALVLAGMVALTAVLLGVCGFLLSRSLRHSLRRLGDVARSIATGNLEARVTITTDDELGVLARAINDMANDLQLLVGEMESSAERDGFGSQLAEALEMADTESDALAMIERAMRTARDRR